VLALVSIGAAPQPQPYTTTYVGPTGVLLADADSTLYYRTKQWVSGDAREQDKLLLMPIRMSYWRNHLPAEMRMVFDGLGYPTGRVRLTPVGHTEEWWYYGPLNAPLRFRDGALLDRKLFDEYRAR
jgi:hypothetical protein